ncbi:prepilin-type N-terminal cleavage/methylation domain-containing protein [Candidatus Sumerlaeota bacterium]|nr:prepilin-type N-terminal cleavage/methylation domain-containing protein [Candidatus Sumerlaeota bacterium]
MTSRIGRQTDLARARRAMTLVELIIVMGLLALLMGIAAPRLSGFIGGRGLRDEARRFQGLTRYAANSAVSRSAPMILWLNSESGAYGLDIATGFEQDDWGPLQFQLSDGCRFEVDPSAADDKGQVEIRYEPDGNVDADSLTEVRIWRLDKEFITIRRETNGNEFENQ